MRTAAEISAAVKRRQAAYRAAGKCSCGGERVDGKASCLRCLSRVRRPTDRAPTYNAALRAAIKGAREMAEPIIPVRLSACVVGGAVVVAR